MAVTGAFGHDLKAARVAVGFCDDTDIMSAAGKHIGNVGIRLEVEFVGRARDQTRSLDRNI